MVLTPAVSALDPRASIPLAIRVRDRLEERAAAVPFSPRVHDFLGVLDLTRDVQDGISAPTIVVACLREQATPNQVPDPDQGGVVQRVTATIGVYVGVPSHNDPGGRKWKAGAALDTLVAQVRTALLAWAPDGQFPAGRWAPLELRDGRLASLRSGVAWWEARYETHRLMRGAPPAEAPAAVPSTVYSGLYEADPSHQRGRLTGTATC